MRFRSGKGDANECHRRGLLALERLEARVAPELRAEVRAIRLLLADPERQWIGTVEAQRLLGVQSINTVNAWARLGLLRSRRGPSGRLKVHLDDVLREARAQRDLDALGGIDEPPSAEGWDALAGQSTPEGKAIVGEIVRLAKAREGKTPGRR